MQLHLNTSYWLQRWKVDHQNSALQKWAANSLRSSHWIEFSCDSFWWIQRTMLLNWTMKFLSLHWFGAVSTVQRRDSNARKMKWNVFSVFDQNFLCCWLSILLTTFDSLDISFVFEHDKLQQTSKRNTLRQILNKNHPIFYMCNDSDWITKNISLQKSEINCNSNPKKAVGVIIFFSARRSFQFVIFSATQLY